MVSLLGTNSSQVLMFLKCHYFTIISEEQFSWISTCRLIVSFLYLNNEFLLPYGLSFPLKINFWFLPLFLLCAYFSSACFKYLSFFLNFRHLCMICLFDSFVVFNSLVASLIQVRSYYFSSNLKYLYHQFFSEFSDILSLVSPSGSLITYIFDLFFDIFPQVSESMFSFSVFYPLYFSLQGLLYLSTSLLIFSSVMPVLNPMKCLFSVLEFCLSISYSFHFSINIHHLST